MFDRNSFSFVLGDLGGRAQRIWLYAHDTDDKDDVAAPGYFAGAEDHGVRVGDPLLARLAGDQTVEGTFKSLTTLEIHPDTRDLANRNVETANDIPALKAGPALTRIDVRDTGAIYRRVSGIPTHGVYKTSTDGVIFELRPERATPQMFGAPYNPPGLAYPTASARPAFASWMAYCAAAGVPGYCPPGGYRLTFTSSAQGFQPAEGMHLTFDPGAFCWVDMSAMWAWADVADDEGGDELDLFSTDFETGVSNWSITGGTFEAVPNTVWAGQVFRVCGDNIKITDFTALNCLRQGMAFFGGSIAYKTLTDVTVDAGSTLVTSPVGVFDIGDVGKRYWMRNASMLTVSDGVIDADPDLPGTPLTRFRSATRVFKDTDIGNRIVIPGKGPGGAALETTIAAIKRVLILGVMTVVVTLSAAASSAGTGLTADCYRGLETKIARFISPTQVRLAAAPALAQTLNAYNWSRFTHFGPPVVLRRCTFKINPLFYGYEAGGGIRVVRGSVQVFDCYCECNDDCFQTVTGRAPYSDIFGADIGDVIFQSCRGGSIRGKLMNSSTSVRSFDIAEYDADADGFAAYNIIDGVTYLDVRGYSGHGVRVSNDSSEGGPKNIWFINCAADCSQAFSTFTTLTDAVVTGGAPDHVTSASAPFETRYRGGQITLNGTTYNIAQIISPTEVRINNPTTPGTGLTARIIPPETFGIDISGKVDHVHFLGGGLYNPSHKALNIEEGSVKNGPDGLLKPTNITFDDFTFDAPRVPGLNTAYIGLCEDLAIRNSTFYGRPLTADEVTEGIWATTDVIQFGVNSGVITRGVLTDNTIRDIPSDFRAILADGTLDSIIATNKGMRRGGQTGTVGLRVGAKNTRLDVHGNDFTRCDVAFSFSKSATMSVILGRNSGDTPTDASLIASATTAQILDSSSTVNTVDKVAGRLIRNSTLGSFLMRADGALAGSAWRFRDEEFDPLRPSAYTLDTAPAATDADIATLAGISRIDGSAGDMTVPASKNIRAVGTSGGGTLYRTNLSLLSSDQFVEAVAASTMAGAAGPLLLLWVDAASADNWIGLRWSSADIEIVTRIAGVTATTVVATQAILVNQRIRFEIEEGVARVLVNGVQAGSDFTIPGSLPAGVRGGLMARNTAVAEWIKSGVTWGSS
jgi:hypothetical protein